MFENKLPGFVVAFLHCGKAVVFSSIDSESKKNKSSLAKNRDPFLA